MVLHLEIFFMRACRKDTLIADRKKEKGNKKSAGKLEGQEAGKKGGRKAIIRTE